jgi:putative Mn2+ efflux pump MntP
MSDRLRLSWPGWMAASSDTSREGLCMITVIILGLALGLDSFRASVAMAASKLSAGQTLRVVLAFGICDGLAPLVGLALNRITAIYVASLSELIAPVVLIGFGAYVLFQRLDAEKGEADLGWSILGVPLCLSLDNLVAGIGLETLGPPVLPSAIAIGILSGVMSLAGMTLGRLGGLVLPVSLERLSGLLLVGLGVAAAFD